MIDFDAIERNTLQDLKFDQNHTRELALYKLGYLIYIFAQSPNPLSKLAIDLIQLNLD